MRRLLIEETDAGQIHLMAGAHIDVIAATVEGALSLAMEQAGIVVSVGGEQVIRNEHTMALALSDLMGHRTPVSWNEPGVLS